MPGNKLPTSGLMGKTAMGHPVQAGRSYVQTVGPQYRFQVVGSDTVRNDGVMGLTDNYVRVQ